MRSRKRLKAFTPCKTYDIPFHCLIHALKPAQVHIRKVKLLKQPKFDLGALLNLHGESTTDEQGQKVEREFKEQVLESV